MGPALRLAYGAAGRLARFLAGVAPEGGGKVTRTLRARRGIRERYERWGRGGRDPALPLLWMHAPSVGEGLQARPVLELMRREHPEVQLAYTHYSPSAESFARALDVDFVDYLPFDTEGDAAAALAALRPRALVFSKLDVWPVLAACAAARGVRLGLVSGTLSRDSSRRSRLASVALRGAYARLDAVGAVSADDAERLAALGVRREALSVTGDTRYDQVWARAARADRRGELLAPLASDRVTLVAGSTWPTDESRLLRAFLAVRASVPDLRLIIAPHEPTAAHLSPLLAWARGAGVRLERLGRPEASAAEVVLVDRVGVLGELYALADVAFVGGAFHAAGLHSVLEPAAFGAPVLFGPQHSASRDAALLLAAGGALASATADELADRLELWARRPDERHTAGEAARGVVASGLGAARRSFELVARLLQD